MSFILDALRKADSERRSGSPSPPHVAWLDPAAPPSAPTPMPMPMPATSGAGGRLRWLAAGVALGMAVLAAGGWWLGRDEPPVPAPPDPLAARPAAGLEPMPAAAAGMQPPAVSAGPDPASGPATASAPVTPPVSAVAPPRPPEPAPVQAALPAPGPARPVVPVRRSAPARPDTEPVAAAPVVPREDLPAESRRSLPPLAVGGAVFSNDPASRLLILDGQIVREGDRVGPDLVLERIGPRSAILNRRGERFSIGW